MQPSRDDNVAVTWARRRAAGERVDAIAAEAGCAPITVYRATQPYGPFLQPQQARRYLGADSRSGDWIRRRRDRESIASIAAADGAPERLVREMTRAHGPYPPARSSRKVSIDEETIANWVTARRAGQTLSAIAETAGVSVRTVSQSTALYGPFHPGGQDNGLLGINAVATLLGMTDSTIVRWRDTGFLPTAHTRAARGHDLWDPADILTWADEVGLATCPHCRARPKDLKRHVRMLHTGGSES